MGGLPKGYKRKKNRIEKKDRTVEKVQSDLLVLVPEMEMYFSYFL